MSSEPMTQEQVERIRQWKSLIANARGSITAESTLPKKKHNSPEWILIIAQMLMQPGPGKQITVYSKNNEESKKVLKQILNLLN